MGVKQVLAYVATMIILAAGAVYPYLRITTTLAVASDPPWVLLIDSGYSEECSALFVDQGGNIIVAMPSATGLLIVNMSVDGSINSVREVTINESICPRDIALLPGSSIYVIVGETPSGGIVYSTISNGVLKVPTPLYSVVPASSSLVYAVGGDLIYAIAILKAPMVSSTYRIPNATLYAVAYNGTHIAVGGELDGDAFVAIINASNMTVEKVITIATPYPDWVSSLRYVGSTLYAVATVSYPPDILALKIGPSGDIEWYTAINTGGSDVGTAIWANDTVIVVAGYSDGLEDTWSSGYDYLIAMFYENGTPIYAIDLGAQGDDLTLRHAEVYPLNGYLALAGFTSSWSANDYDALVALVNKSTLLIEYDGSNQMFYQRKLNISSIIVAPSITIGTASISLEPASIDTSHIVVDIGTGTVSTKLFSVFKPAVTVVTTTVTRTLVLTNTTTVTSTVTTTRTVVNTTTVTATTTVTNTTTVTTTKTVTNTTTVVNTTTVTKVVTSISIVTHTYTTAVTSTKTVIVANATVPTTVTATVYKLELLGETARIDSIMATGLLITSIVGSILAIYAAIRSPTPSYHIYALILLLISFLGSALLMSSRSASASEVLVHNGTATYIYHANPFARIYLAPLAVSILGFMALVMYYLRTSIKA